MNPPRGDYPPRANTSLAHELDRCEVETLVSMFAYELVRVEREPAALLDWRDEIAGAIARKQAPAEHPPVRYIAPHGWTGRTVEHTTFVCGACPNPAGCRTVDACDRAVEARERGQENLADYSGGFGGKRYAPEGDPEFMPVEP